MRRVHAIKPDFDMNFVQAIAEMMHPSLAQPYVDGFTADIYDAGSEANNERCSHIPGPPCADTSGNAQASGEGAVPAHRGLTGAGDLDAAALGWSGAPVQITIHRL